VCRVLRGAAALPLRPGTCVWTGKSVVLKLEKYYKSPVHKKADKQMQTEQTASAAIRFEFVRRPADNKIILRSESLRLF
jgi:hypothetical protein